MSKELLNKKTNKGSSWRGVLLFAFLVLIDQLTKVIADVYYAGDTSRYTNLITDKLGLCISYNRGIAFGNFAGSSQALKIGIIVGTVVLMLALAVLYFRLDKRRSLLRFAIVLVVAGGIGNFIDRVYYQVWNPATLPLGVRDMVRWNIIFDFGIFNFADVCISFGTVFLVLSLVFFDTDAIFPLGKKYRALAKEADEKSKAKKQAKKQKKEAQKEVNNG